MGNLYSKWTGPKNEGLFTERYKVGVVSGTHKWTGLDAEMTLVVVGAGGRSAAQVLKRPIAGEHKGPHVEVFYINTNTDLGQIGAVEVFNSGRGKAASWELIKVVVDKVMEGGLQHETYWERWVFPCYAYVPELRARLFFAGAPASIPSRTPWWLVEQRSKALHEKRRQYNWKQYQGLPAGLDAERVDDLPRDDHLPSWHEKDFKVATANHVIRKGLSSMLGDHSRWTTLNEKSALTGAIIRELYMASNLLGEAEAGSEGSQLPRPLASKPESGVHWEHDLTFSRQFTQGVHAGMLQVCRQLPPEMIYGLNLTSIQFRPAMNLTDEMNAGRVYVVDYTSLKPFFKDPLQGVFMAAPVCYFYMMEDPHHRFSEEPACLLPIAIRLDPDNRDAPIFTPDDSQWDWNTAKAFVTNADAQFHMVVSYFLKTCAVTEPFVVAMHRQLSVMHPVNKLLRSYSHHSLAYTCMARGSLVGVGSLVEQLFSISDEVGNFLQSEYSRWRFEDMALPYSLQTRGFDGREFCPDYPHREDGLLVWAALVDFVKDYVSIYYHADEDIEDDAELQAWYQEAFMTGHALLVQAGSLQVEELDSRNALAKVLVFLIWTFCGQNTALTRASYDAYGFPPNRPTILKRPPPTEKGTCTEATFLEMLPTKGQSASAICYMHWRSERTTLAAPLMGPQIEEHLLDPDALESFDRFQESLRLVQKVLEGRNDKREVPYLWLLPSMISTGLVH